MKKSDNERIKKIIDIWSSLQLQIKEHSITKENLLNDFICYIFVGIDNLLITIFIEAHALLFCND